MEDELSRPRHSLQRIDAVVKALKELHKFQVVHRDAELRNILCDDMQGGNLMIVD